MLHVLLVFHVTDPCVRFIVTGGGIENAHEALEGGGTDHISTSFSHPFLLTVYEYHLAKVNAIIVIVPICVY